jgi:hypothetical protein
MVNGVHGFDSRSGLRLRAEGAGVSIRGLLMKLILATLAIALFLSASSAAAQSREFIAGITTSAPRNILAEISKVDGSPVAVYPTGGNLLTGMVMRTTDRVMFGVTSAGSTCSSCLVQINVNTGALTPVGPLGHAIGDLAFAGQTPASGPPFTLYGYDPASGNMYTLNTTTGAATLLGATGVASPSGGGIAFGNGAKLFLSNKNDNGQTYTVDLTNGAASPAVVLNGSPCRLGGAAGCPVFASDTDPTATPSSAFNVGSQGDTAGGGFFLLRQGGGGALTPYSSDVTATLTALAFYNPPPAPVPTLGGWGFAAFAVLLAGLGMMAMRLHRVKQ